MYRYTPRSQKLTRLLAAIYPLCCIRHQRHALWTRHPGCRVKHVQTNTSRWVHVVLPSHLLRLVYRHKNCHCIHHVAIISTKMGPLGYSHQLGIHDPDCHWSAGLRFRQMPTLCGQLQPSHVRLWPSGIGAGETCGNLLLNRGTCLPGNGFIIVSYFGSVVQVVTDWVCAIVPFFVVKDLQMPKRKKISLLAVLMLGVLASIASLIRMPYYKYYDQVAYPNNYFCKSKRNIHTTSYNSKADWFKITRATLLYGQRWSAVSV